MRAFSAFPGRRGDLRRADRDGSDHRGRTEPSFGSAVRDHPALLTARPPRPPPRSTACRPCPSAPSAPPRPRLLARALRFHCLGPPDPLLGRRARGRGRISSRPRGSRSSAPSSAPRRGCASVTFGLGLNVLPAGSARRPTLLWTRGISPQRIGSRQSARFARALHAGGGTRTTDFRIMIALLLGCTAPFAGAGGPKRDVSVLVVDRRHGCVAAVRAGTARSPCQGRPGVGDERQDVAAGQAFDGVDELVCMASWKAPAAFRDDGGA